MFVFSDVLKKSSDGCIIPKLHKFSTLIFILIWLCTPVQAGVDPVEKAEALEKLRSEISKIQSKINETSDKRNEIADKLRESEKKIGVVASRINSLVNSEKTKRARLVKLRKQQGEHEKDLSKHKSTLEQQVVSAYMIGRQQYVKLILNQRDPATVARTFVYYDYLNRARTRQIDTVLTKLREIEALQRAIANEVSAIEEIKQKQLAEQSRLENIRKARANLLAVVNRQLDAEGAQLKKMQVDEAQLGKLVDELNRALIDIPQSTLAAQPFATRRGKLTWPVAGKFAAKFGRTRHNSELKWQGVLLAADIGTPVRTVANGRIVYADWFRGLGLLVIVDHGQGFMTLYGHNQAIYKEVGEWVEEGEQLADVGDSGGQSQSGLYFEVRQAGEPVNPSIWCAGLPTVADR